MSVVNGPEKPFKPLIVIPWKSSHYRENAAGATETARKYLPPSHLNFKEPSGVDTQKFRA